MDYQKVRIKDAFKGDAGRGRIRIDPNIIIDLKLRIGDAIEISHPVSAKKTAAILYPGKIEAKGTNIIRIDSSSRRNIGVSLDDVVQIRKIQVSLADRLIFAGIEESLVLKRPDQLVKVLENRIITIGDVLSFNAKGRRIDFMLIDYAPRAAAVRIHLDTKITITLKTYKQIQELMIFGKNI